MAPMSEIDITRVETESERAALQVPLGEFHNWMASHDSRYDPAAAHESDARTVSSGTDCIAWLARVDGDRAGCVLLYWETDDLAEFRRLWVRPDYRRHGVGRELLGTVIETARQEGSETLALTTPPWGAAGHALYESMGFERTPPYPETRLDEQFHDDAIFMQLDLTAMDRAVTGDG